MHRFYLLIVFISFLAISFTSLFYLHFAYAQQYQTQSTAVTNVGNPTTGGGPGPAPSTNTCKGVNSNIDGYILDNPKHVNFGDPNCDFTKDALYTYIKQIDQKYADRWYWTIIPHESGYNPNAYTAGSASGKGAYGLIQMNPYGRGNNQFDAGDVYWKNQMSNGVQYNQIINNNSGTCPNGVYYAHNAWCYWATASQWWGQPL